MNSERLPGILVEWLKPTNQRDYNNLVMEKDGVENADFRVLNWSAPCPVTDGSPIDFTGAPNEENLEWLMYFEGARVIGYDIRLYIENNSQCPTNKKDSVFINYNHFENKYQLEKRSNAELTSVVRQKESEANLSVLNEAEKNKLAMFSNSVNAKLASGIPLEPWEQAVYVRNLEVSEKGFQNSENANALITAINAGSIPNVDLGWTYDNITPLGIPFNG